MDHTKDLLERCVQIMARAGLTVGDEVTLRNVMNLPGFIIRYHGDLKIVWTCGEAP
jgi:hypothetical protein